MFVLSIHTETPKMSLTLNVETVKKLWETYTKRLSFNIKQAIESTTANTNHIHTHTYKLQRAALAAHSTHTNLLG